MAAADFELVRALGQYPRMTDGAFTLIQDIDFAEHNIGAGESADFMVTPQEPVLLDNVVAYLITAEGGTLTIDIGDEANPDGWLDGGDANGTPGALIATGTAVAYAGPKLYAAGTPLRITCANAADAGKVRVVAWGRSIGRP
jgi:hypothetical protein